MKFNDAILGAMVMALGAIVLFAIRGYPKIPGQPVGPALFPGLIATGLLVAGALLIVAGWRAHTRQADPWFVPEDWVRSPRHIGALALLLGCIVLYIVAADTVGFLIISTVILAAMFLVLGVPPRRALLIAVIASLLIHFAFYKLLRVPLPWGWLAPIAW